MPRMPRMNTALPLLLSLILVSPLVAGEPTLTMTFEPSKDNTLFEDVTGGTSNGAGQQLFVGKTGQGDIRRALLAFDISALPSGSTVISATVSLDMNKTTNGAQDIELRAVTSDWGEGTSDADGNEGQGTVSTTGDATWIHTFFNTGMWTTAGGDFSSMVSATQSVVGLGIYTWTGAAVAADVQGWLDNPMTNLGWILIGNEAMSATAKRFGSREQGSSLNRPKLVIEFTNPDLLFADGFETGNTTAWFLTIPAP